MSRSHGHHNGHKNNPPSTRPKQYGTNINPSDKNNLRANVFSSADDAIITEYLAYEDWIFQEIQAAIPHPVNAVALKNHLIGSFCTLDEVKAHTMPAGYVPKGPEAIRKEHAEAAKHKERDGDAIPIIDNTTPEPIGITERWTPAEDAVLSNCLNADTDTWGKILPHKTMDQITARITELGLSLPDTETEKTAVPEDKDSNMAKSLSFIEKQSASAKTKTAPTKHLLPNGKVAWTPEDDATLLKYKDRYKYDMKKWDKVLSTKRSAKAIQMRLYALTHRDNTASAAPAKTKAESTANTPTNIASNDGITAAANIIRAISDYTATYGNINVDIDFHNGITLHLPIDNQ